MKALYEALTLPDALPFLIREFDQTAFEAPFHYHPEIELTLILTGQGERYVGSHMDRFEAGDLVMIGENTPHCWKLEQGVTSSSCIVLQFQSNFLGDQIFRRPAMSSIGQLLEKSGQGIRVTGNLRKDIANRMCNIVGKSHPTEMSILLLQLLYQITAHREWHFLTTTQNFYARNTTDRDRMLRVMNYIQQHFKEPIKLDDVAAEINLTAPAFCKFFKRSTRMTLMEVVNGYRLDYATNLLTGTDRNISEIAYESGFRDLSYFYKVFKTHKERTPASYRKHFLS